MKTSAFWIINLWWKFPHFDRKQWLDIVVSLHISWKIPLSESFIVLKIIFWWVVCTFWKLQLYESLSSIEKLYGVNLYTILKIRHGWIFMLYWKLPHHWIFYCSWKLNDDESLLYIENYFPLNLYRILKIIFWWIFILSWKLIYNESLKSSENYWFMNL